MPCISTERGCGSTSEWIPLGTLPASRPYFLLNAAMTLDGKIATRGGDTKLSDIVDWHYVHGIRARVDAIMVGVNTVLKDNPSLQVKFHSIQKYPRRVIVDSRGRTPLDANVICRDAVHYQTILCCTRLIDPERKRAYENAGVKVLLINDDGRVDPLAMAEALFAEGIHTVLCEGGGSLNWSILVADLIDEIRLFVAPVVAGGTEATGLFGGSGFETLTQSPAFQLHSVEKRENFVTLRYTKIKPVK
ncbi:MAG: 2,5-diamino-6-hydroxy-4-(5-phosphoribosylamino)pyrimidine 1-reductase [Promethearchaeota archaeon CR_4]|nr:MAG: 2,5-diamino-6-hydroxy-4-(5-phosphoribosylamino)pyrimidine 1-reductase [Candidatus Lokiarchaeota archaeon CR_4]